MAHSAIEWAQQRCAEYGKSCRWLNQALGLIGGEGCFWTDLMNCAQDCGSPPLIASDSSSTGGFDCYLDTSHWRFNSANLIGVTLNAWLHITDENDPRLFAQPAVRITGVRTIQGQWVWQATNDPAHPVIGFYYDPWSGTLHWYPDKPQAWADVEAGLSPQPNMWPGLAQKDSSGYLLPSADCFVVDVDFTAPDGRFLGKAAVLFNAVAW